MSVLASNKNAAKRACFSDICDDGPDVIVCPSLWQSPQPFGHLHITICSWPSVMGREIVLVLLQSFHSLISNQQLFNPLLKSLTISCSLLASSDKLFLVSGDLGHINKLVFDRLTYTSTFMH